MLRKTQQREAIRRVLVEAGRPLSPQEIADAAQEHAPGVGLATVYRTVKRFSEEGWLVSIALPGESPRYELAGKTHHHHFRCRVCDTVFELPACGFSLERLLPRGFQLEQHDLVLYGRCASCQGRSRSRAR
jgi:Fur family ferric uptake transcriptional regulator